MASSAASALPAWVDRRERCLDTNGPPIRRLRINHQHQHNRSPPRSHNYRIDLFGSLAHGSHHDPMPARVFPSARPCTRSPRVSRDIRIDLDDRRSPARRIVVVSTVCRSQSRLIAFHRSRAASCHRRYCARLFAGHLQSEQCDIIRTDGINKAMNTRGICLIMHHQQRDSLLGEMTRLATIFQLSSDTLRFWDVLKNVYWWLNLAEKRLSGYELNVANDIWILQRWLSLRIIEYSSFESLKALYAACLHSRHEIMSRSVRKQKIMSFLAENKFCSMLQSVLFGNFMIINLMMIRWFRMQSLNTKFR